MADRETRATLSPGRESFCITYRHPVARASDGKSKLRVRRGLGTSDDAEAARLVAEMNQLMADPAMHTVAAKARATIRFDARIVAAFYDYLEPTSHDAWGERERSIPLPGSHEGYAKALMLGTTGSGKTTLLRQFIGTDPARERFPSTSAAKTTTADIEVILAAGPFSAAVSFLPQDHVRLYVADCAVAAVSGHLEGASSQEIVRRFVEHSDQRFRLNYLLGAATSDSAEPDEEFFDEDVSDEQILPSEVTDEERLQNVEKMQGFLRRIEDLARQCREEIVRAAQELRVDLDRARPQDREAIRDLVEERLITGPDFDRLVDDVFDEIERRFSFVQQGHFTRGRSGWPVVWTFTSDDRTEFIRTVNKLSSNYAPNFGRLLTPIVDGIRVRGPFQPSWLDGDAPRVVFLDGQGIGHTADSSASISTSITRRFMSVDAIVLVDNAAQPMQAGSVAVLRSLATSGHEGKLVVCFTHFDDVSGDNLPDIKAKRAHVTGSFFNAVHALGQQLGREAEASLQRLSSRLVFVADIQEEVGHRTRTAAELRKLGSMIMNMIEPVAPAEMRPIYDIANLVLAIQKAAQAFHQRWRGVLTSEHWARIKALSRRLAIFNEDEYDQLRPVGDLILQLQSFIHTFVAQPMAWEPPVATDERLDEKIQVTDAIRQAVSSRLHDLARRRVMDSKTKDWSAAFYRSGPGSTVTRARDIRSIYDSAAPIPAEMADTEATEFMFEVRAAVGEAIREGNGLVRGWEP